MNVLGASTSKANAILTLVGVLGMALCSHAALAQSRITSAAEERECGPLRSADSQLLDPKDYRTDRAWLSMVEQHHFSPDVENLVKPIFLTFGSSISYTLHGYPNHIRALASMVRLGQKEKTDKPAGSVYTIDCWFRRALRFVPDDLLVRLLYASYLGKRGRQDDALRQLNFVDETAPADAGVRKNLGLVFLELGQVDRAQAQLTKFDPTDPYMATLVAALEKYPRSAASAASAASSPTAAPAVPASAPASDPAQ